MLKILLNTVLFIFILSSCGQSGRLYLPSDPAKIPVTTNKANTPDEPPN